MIPDALYDLAFAFRKTKLWDQLYDTQLFAVGHSDGSVGYCSVMGRMREHLALGVYPGLPGLEAYRRMGKRRPSIETGLHCAIYRARSEVNAVIHTHPIYSMVFSCTGEDIPLLMDEAAQCMGDTCRTAEYALPGSPELAENCIKALGEKANACLLKSHGAVCLGADMKSAFRVVKVLEVTAQIYQMIRSMGACYCPISQENIEKMQYFVCNLYGQV